VNPVSWARGRFLRAVRPMPAGPLVVLFAIYAADQFDTTAFSTLAPEIRRAFGLSTTGFSAIVALNLALIVGLAVPLGWLADRSNRVRLVWVSAAVAGVFSVATGMAFGVWMLMAFRLGNGIGLLANDPVHTSLLTDLYPPENRPEVFSVHRTASSVGGILGPPVAGGIALVLGWRAAFFIMAIPIGVAVLFALRLEEPHRGATDNPDDAAAAAGEPPVPFARAVRILYTVSTLKRQFVSSVFLGGAAFALVSFFSLFQDDVLHVGPAGRGIVGAIDAGAALCGILLGGHLTRTRWLPRGLDVPQRYAGLAIMGTGVALFAVAASPSLPVFVVTSAAVSFVGNMYLAPMLTTTALVAPPRIRTQAFTFSLLFLACGAVFVPVIGAVADAAGLRWAIVALAPLWLVAGAVIWSAHRFVEGDVLRALQTLATAAQLRSERDRADERDSILVCRGVSVSYGQVQVLFGVDLELRRGEIVALLGTNGAGKSTLLKAINGSVVPSAGVLFFDGHDVSGLLPDQALAAGIVLAPGGKGVFPTLTVRENLALAGWLFHKEPAYLAEATEEVFGYFPILRDRLDAKAGNMSGGEQQMLTLAQAFIARPKLLMIDELSLGLAPKIVEELLEVVRAVHRRGTTIVLVEQSVNVALTLAHRAVFMEKGEVRFDGPTAELLERPDVLRSVFLEGASGSLAGSPARTRHRRQQDPTAATPEPVLVTRDLSVSFGGVHAVNGVSLDVGPGRVLGLIGPNGAGKTTILDLISGYVLPTGGTVEVCGHDVTSWSPDARPRVGLGRSFQDARLFPSLTVVQVISGALERHIATRDLLSAALMSPATRRAERAVAARVGELIELMGLQAFANKYVAELSTGSRRIVDLACCLAHEPTVLLLDEPSSGIAQRETEALGPVLLGIRETTGAALVVIEHDMPLITSVADELVALVLGQVVARGTPASVVNDPQVVASYLGTTDEVINRSGTSAHAARPRTRRKRVDA
jgi:ABC-type branched-subunit amino acid transport system ATPase component/predicted MFS family arabinose efflux permease